MGPKIGMKTMMKSRHWEIIIKNEDPVSSWLSNVKSCTLRVVTRVTMTQHSEFSENFRNWRLCGYGWTILPQHNQNSARQQLEKNAQISENRLYKIKSHIRGPGRGPNRGGHSPPGWIPSIYYIKEISGTGNASLFQDFSVFFRFQN
jgi:hypothetical protein